VSALGLGIMAAQRRGELPFGWYRRNADFGGSVLSGITTLDAQTGAERSTHRRAQAPRNRDETLGRRAGGTTQTSPSAEPGPAPAAQAPAALPYQWLRPDAPSAQSQEERERQRQLDLVEGRGWSG
jgi:hypothetical protein